MGLKMERDRQGISRKMEKKVTLVDRRGDGLILQLPKSLGVHHRTSDDGQSPQVQDAAVIDGFIFRFPREFGHQLQVGQVHHCIRPASRGGDAVPNSTLRTGKDGQINAQKKTKRGKVPHPRKMRSCPVWPGRPGYPSHFVPLGSWRRWAT